MRQSNHQSVSLWRRLPTSLMRQKLTESQLIMECSTWDSMMANSKNLRYGDGRRHGGRLRESMRALTRDAEDEMSTVNREILSVIRALGGDQQRYKRERSRAVKAIVSEIHSPPRVSAATRLLPELRLIPGFALDLTTADVDGALWDFTRS